MKKATNSRFKEIFKNITYALFLLDRIHCYLAQVSSDYSAWSQETQRSLSKNFGFRRSIWNKIIDHLGEEPVCSALYVHNLQNNLFEAHLYSNLTNCSTYRLKAAHQPQDDLKLHKGKTYLESIDVADCIKNSTEIITTHVLIQPEFLKQFDRQVYAQGLSVSRITLATYHGSPIVIQRRTDDAKQTIEYTCLGQEDAIDRLKEDVKNLKTCYRGWIASCELGDCISLAYLEKQCIELRLLKRADPVHIDTTKKVHLIEKDNLRSTLAHLSDEHTIIVMRPENLRVIGRLKRCEFLFPLVLLFEDIELLVQSGELIHAFNGLVDGIDAPEHVKILLTSSKKEEVHRSILAHAEIAAHE